LWERIKVRGTLRLSSPLGERKQGILLSPWGRGLGEG